MSLFGHVKFGYYGSLRYDSQASWPDFIIQYPSSQVSETFMTDKVELGSRIRILGPISTKFGLIHCSGLAGFLNHYGSRNCPWIETASIQWLVDLECICRIHSALFSRKKIQKWQNWSLWDTRENTIYIRYSICVTVPPALSQIVPVMFWVNKWLNIIRISILKDIG